MTTTANKSTSAKTSNAAAAANTTAKPVLSINPDHSFTGALFNVENKIDGGPIMSGSVEIGGVKFSVSAFLKTGPKKDYLSISIGEKDGVHYYGKLFKNKESYSGSLTLLANDEQSNFTDEDFDNALKLVIGGERKRNSDGGARIALTFSPQAVKEEEVAF